MTLIARGDGGRQTRTVVRDRITTVTNEQQLKRTQEVCIRQLFKIELFNVIAPLRARLIRNQLAISKSSRRLGLVACLEGQK